MFYYGVIAKQIVAASKAHGDVLSLQDFSNYNVEITKTLYCNYRGYTIMTAPTPSSGATVCEILNIVNGYSLSQLGFHSALTTHYNIEAMRYAFADRNQYLGDPNFVKIPLKRLLSNDYAKQIRSKILVNKLGNSKKLVCHLTK